MATRTSFILAAALGAALALPAATSLAEPGDYGFFKTLRNLISPPQANRPVSHGETQGMYPLQQRQSGFNDGFSPGKYDNWQQVDVPVSSGAMCGNGSPYKFFVYRVPDTSNTILYFEGGGACWDYASCTGQTGIRGARNPNGIADGYVQNINLLDFQNTANLGTAAASPLIYTHHPYNQFKTGEWNIVYVPYCTGDIYVGDRTTEYVNPDNSNETLVWHHNGLRNVQSVVSWVRNNLQEPKQLTVAGCSAGSIGALLNYSKLRGHFGSTYGYLIDDSGPVFEAPLNTSDTSAYPSVPLHQEVLSSWTDTSVIGNPTAEHPLNMLSALTPGFDSNRLASLYGGLSGKFPGDRLGITHFLADGNFSSYSYERFYPDIGNDPDPDSKLNKLRARWQQDTADNLIPLLNATGNWSYYFPLYRDFNESHCVSVLDFRYGEIEELGLDTYDFMNNVVNYRGGPPLRAVESLSSSDYADNHDWFYDLVGSLL
ncbi:pectin acetylesterase-family hydrolase [Parahaliea mediterranea]|uniref:pectin acetylesterase-family hydrolase n=1 Tax=Parahaliea mediterranea TaxID=651086 RepID=UPI000E2ED5A9|nr:pectin acetylesterase-family hydrolase [Parahaliea mediterranea]